MLSNLILFAMKMKKNVSLHFAIPFRTWRRTYHCVFIATVAAVRLLALPAWSAETNVSESVISESRVAEIAAELALAPFDFGKPVSDRAAWKEAADYPGMQSVISEADKLAQEPDPELPDSLYLDFSRTGNRDRCQAVMYARSRRLALFTLAECLEDKGRFLKPLEKTIEVLCSERAWTYPAHDSNLDVFEGRAMNPDLRATTLAFDLATSDYLLGDKLSSNHATVDSEQC